MFALVGPQLQVPAAHEQLDGVRLGDDVLGAVGGAEAQVGGGARVVPGLGQQVDLEPAQAGHRSGQVRTGNGVSHNV